MKRIEQKTGHFIVKAERGEWDLTLGADDDLRLVSFLFNDLPAPIKVPLRNSTPMHLPFKGEWTITYGGSTGADNPHVFMSCQSRAFDACVFDSKGLHYQNNGLDNLDHHAYEMEVLASADGKVEVAVDGVPDNRPETTNLFTSAGNYVILKHADFEYSVYMHLKRDSVAVKAGTRVKAGERLGR